MYLNLRHEITQQAVQITTSDNSPDNVVDVTFDGELKETLIRDLKNNAYGYYGNILNTAEYNNLDLYSAVLILPDWKIIESRGVPTPSLKQDVEIFENEVS